MFVCGGNNRVEYHSDFKVFFVKDEAPIGIIAIMQQWKEVSKRFFDKQYWKRFFKKSEALASF